MSLLPTLLISRARRLRSYSLRWLAGNPELALDGGADGLDAYTKLAPEIARLLVNDGFAAVEISWRQAAAVRALSRRWTGSPQLVRDLAGRERCLMIEHDIIGAEKNSWKNDVSRLG